MTANLPLISIVAPRPSPIAASKISMFYPPKAMSCTIQANPTEEISWAEQSLFDDLSRVTEVFVLGHTLTHVDEPNFSAILDRVDAKANRSVSYHNDEDAA